MNRDEWINLAAALVAGLVCIPAAWGVFMGGVSVGREYPALSWPMMIATIPVMMVGSALLWFWVANRVRRMLNGKS